MKHPAHLIHPPISFLLSSGQVVREFMGKIQVVEKSVRIVGEVRGHKIPRAILAALGPNCPQFVLAVLLRQFRPLCCGWSCWAVPLVLGGTSLLLTRHFFRVSIRRRIGFCPRVWGPTLKMWLNGRTWWVKFKGGALNFLLIKMFSLWNLGNFSATGILI